ncbi:MAG: sialate O-acetylesterase, partial [Prevotella sp.]|nr:sialate O-acetylesterase [Prevotella sp.]
ELPFYYVQLANFHEHHSEPVEALWAELREAQAMALHLPQTGMASAIDVGLGHDVHYPNKQEVARRLALIALAKTYGQPIEYSGPMYKDYTIDGHKVMVSFTHADGLTAKDDQLREFCIAGSDHVWHNAQARIVSQDKVEVWSDEVKYPVAVRYLWQDNPEATLYNAAGLPANPFRTDDWPLLSQGKTRSNSDY